jgi:DNA-binding HxlR family transcriptional regulator
MALLDLLGRRMTLRILWELRERQLTFRALQQAAETNPSVLNARLKELRGARLVEHSSNGYALAQPGKDLLATFLPLHAWAETWAELLKTGNLGGAAPGSGRASATAHPKPRPRRAMHLRATSRTR